MAEDRRNGEPATELIYLPEPSWYPALLAFGLAGVLAGLWVWWPYSVLGAIVALVALRGWIVQARDSFDRLPRRQRLATAAIPAEELRRPR
jgi:hypothetical protein